MKTKNKIFSVAILAIGVGAMAPVWAQENSSPGGWRRVDAPETAQAPTQQAPAPQRRDDFVQNPDRVPAPAPMGQTYAQLQRTPSQITIPAGTWLAVRINQPLSSDRNLAGDTFTATLTQPVVADGIVVARRGQTLGGRVAEAIKAGRAKGTSRLGVEITELSLVDGQQLPIRAQLVETSAGPSKGRDATAIGTTTGLGAAIGAMAGGGFGAGMGAIAGAGAGAIGILATRGKATEIYPEEIITFRTLAPLTISTERAEQAFQPVQQQDYQTPNQLQQRVSRPQTVYPVDPFWGSGFYSPFYGPYWGPGFFGPRVNLFYGRGFYGGGFRGRR